MFSVIVIWMVYLSLFENLQVGVVVGLLVVVSCFVGMMELVVELFVRIVVVQLDVQCEVVVVVCEYWVWYELVLGFGYYLYWLDDLCVIVLLVFVCDVGMYGVYCDVFGLLVVEIDVVVGKYIMINVIGVIVVLLGDFGILFLLMCGFVVFSCVVGLIVYIVEEQVCLLGCFIW